MVNIVVTLIYGGVKLLRYVETDIPLSLAYPVQRVEPPNLLDISGIFISGRYCGMTPFLIKSGRAEI